MAASVKLSAFDFEVHGRVQGVFFRKHTKSRADELGIVGWIMNTDHATVKGQAEGPSQAMDDFRSWLSMKGSPQSRIAKADFSEERDIPRRSFNSFTVRR